MENVLKALVQVLYLAVLSHGKSRPDTKNSLGTTIRDAKDNMNEINAVKESLGSYFNLPALSPNAKSDRRTYE